MQTPRGQSASKLLEACGELGFLSRNAYMVLVLAELAAGDAAAAMEACETGLQSKTNAAVQEVRWCGGRNAALACGDTVRARQWADRAAAAGAGMFLCLTFAVRARVHLAEDNNEQAAADVYDGLAIGASMDAIPRAYPTSSNVWRSSR